MKIIFDRKKHQACALEEDRVIGICEFTIEKDKDGNDRFWIANDHKGGIKLG